MKYLILFLCLCISSFAADYTLPADRQATWTPGTADGTPGVGVPGGIAQYLAGGVADRAVTGTLVNMANAPYSCATDGSTDCKAAIQQAIDDASGSTVLYFPAGDYLISNGFIFTNYKDYITIRGAGIGVTTFVTSTTQPIFVMNDSGGATNLERVVAGTKTKGTTTLTLETSPGVNDISTYDVGRLLAVRYENEENNARIQAGAPPTWTSLGFPFIRAHTAVIQSRNVGAGTITIYPPLPWDGTNVIVKTFLAPNDSMNIGWGFEDFSVTFNNAAHSSQFIQMNVAKFCWVNNIHFEDWSRATSSGSCVKMTNTYRCEVRRCIMNALSTAGISSDGAIESGGMAACLFEDNIVSGVRWDTAFYESGGSTYNAWLYNYSDVANIFHNANPSLNLIEGNVFGAHQSDGYHGSSSHNIIFRNYYRGGAIILNRMKRNYSLVGNVVGTNGTINGGLSFGNPNIGNGTAYGFAGPTGLSLAAGTYEYSQRDYPGNYVYQIQPADISVGDFWQDWKITGELTAKDGSGLVATFTVSNGFFYTGDDIGGSLLAIAHWDNRTKYASNGVITSVVGSVVQITFPLNVDNGFPSGTGHNLPALGTIMEIFLGPAAFQEKDLDVEPSSENKNNYIALAIGTGALNNTIAPDTLPNSLAYSAQPSWWTNDGYTGTWPPVTPNSPVFSASINPAGARHTASPPPVDTAPPTIIAATVPALGTTIIISFSENVVAGVGGFNGMDLNLTIAPSTATYSSGNGTSNLTYTLSTPIVDSSTGTVSYSPPVAGIKDASGNETVAISGVVIANNSLLPGPSITQKGWRKLKARKLLSVE
jgi:hypothetical protein